ncbi:MAG TPA: hypothetical protein VLC98_11950 [Phnomibacter sp.]|nr:hypothetical protein [Phnomibacter sp.]
MTELINKLIAEAGLSQEQAAKTIEVIKGFVSEKFPMLSGAVENVLNGGATASAANPDITETPSSSGGTSGGSWLDKISDVIPGDVGEKLEGFAKKAADAAEEGFDKAKEVAKDLYEKGSEKLKDFEKKV